MRIIKPMSVSNYFISLDWTRIKDLPATDDAFWSMRSEARDNEEEWIRDVQFGEDEDTFRYFTGLMEFLDWFSEVRETMPPKVVSAFSSVFLDIGILYDDEAYAPRPIKKDTDLAWVTGAIPPADCSKILQRLEKLDRSTIRHAFDEANEENPFDLFEDGETILAWIGSLEEGFQDIIQRGHGMLLVIG